MNALMPPARVPHGVSDDDMLRVAYTRERTTHLALARQPQGQEPPQRLAPQKPENLPSLPGAHQLGGSAASPT